MSEDRIVIAGAVRTGLSMGDFDLIEANEAFASQSIAVARDLKIPAAVER